LTLEGNPIEKPCTSKVGIAEQNKDRGVDKGSSEDTLHNLRHLVRFCVVANLLDKHHIDTSEQNIGDGDHHCDAIDEHFDSCCVVLVVKAEGFAGKKR
jgi:hypothetical protein